ncbi:lactonase family protein [soil metagenome]
MRPFPLTLAFVALGLAACSDPPATLPADDSGVVDAQTTNDASNDAVISVTDAAPSDAGDGATTNAPLFFFVGGGDGKIRVFSVAEPSGALTPLGVASPGGSPSFLALDPVKRHLYAVDENKNQVRAFTFDPNVGSLTDLGAPVASGGNGPTHVSIDATGKVVLVANYGGGTASVFPIMGSGALAAASDTKAPGANAHLAISNPSGGYAFVPALGANLIAQYKLDTTTGKLTANGTVSPPAAAGPRHLAFRPDENFAYGINETASTGTTYAYDQGTGKLTVGATTTTLPQGFAMANTGAELVVHPTGAWVYASNRGSDTIVTFASNETTGALTLVGHVSTGGKTPRSFALDPAAKLLFAANQGSATVAVFTIGSNGAPVASGSPVAVASPTFVGAWRVP